MDTGDIPADGGLAVVQDELVMEGVVPGRTMPKILCCLCGVDIDPNPANMCVNCLRGQVDITEGIPKSLILHQCRGCTRILRPPWVLCEPESRELLAVCLKKITGLNKVKLIDAGFIWTEPHSRRLKVKLTIQKEVLNGVKLQQVFPVEFVLQNQQCDACARSYTDHVWRAMVQVRQKVDHKRTFFLLEQLILKHNAHEKCISVEQLPSGVDFAFSERSHAVKFMDFLGTMVPTRSKSAKQLISEDIHTAEKRYKFSYAVEIVPLCKDDVVVLPKATAAGLGNISRLCIVLRVAANVGLLDPRTLQVAELSSEKYWREPFRPWLSSAKLEEFVVLDITPVTIAPITGSALRRKQGAKARKGRPSAVARLEELRELATIGAKQAPGTSSSISGSSVVSVGGKRPRPGSEGGAGAAAPAGSVAGRMSLNSAQTGAASSFKRGGSGTAGGGGGASFGGRGGGFSGAVSLAGGSVNFNHLGAGGGASTIATTVVGGPRGRMLLADAEVMKASDMGNVDRRFTVRTHLGNILRPGDSVLGYDLSHAVLPDDAEEFGAQEGRGRPGRGRGDAEELGSGNSSSIQRAVDIVLVRKTYPKREERVIAQREIDGEAAASAVAAAARAAEEDDAMDGRPAAASTANGKAGAGIVIRKRQRVWKLKRFEDALLTRAGGEGGAAAATTGGRKGGKAGGGGAAARASAAAAEAEAADFEAFLRDIEEDPALRKHINLYKDADALQQQQRAAAAATSSSGLAPRRGRAAAAAAASSTQSAAAAAPSSNSGGSSSASSAASRKARASAVTAGNDDDDDEDDHSEGEGGEDDGFPEIALDELLDDLTLGDKGAGSADGGYTSAVAASAAGAGGASNGGDDGDEGDDADGEVKYSSGSGSNNGSSGSGSATKAAGIAAVPEAEDEDEEGAHDESDDDL